MEYESRGPHGSVISDQPTVVGTLYLQKWAAHRLEDPETITVTITAG
jgi:hypothetical protein